MLATVHHRPDFQAAAEYIDRTSHSAPAVEFGDLPSGPLTELEAAIALTGSGPRHPVVRLGLPPLEAVLRAPAHASLASQPGALVAREAAALAGHGTLYIVGHVRWPISVLEAIRRLHSHTDRGFLGSLGAFLGSMPARFHPVAARTFKGLFPVTVYVYRGIRSLRPAQAPQPLRAAAVGHKESARARIGRTRDLSPRALVACRRVPLAGHRARGANRSRAFTMKAAAQRFLALAASTRRAKRTHPAALSVCAYAAILAGSAFAAYWTMFSTYATYDDEGYHDWVLRLFAAGHPLYNSVFSYYGPFHYEFWGGLSALTGVTFSTNTGRFVALVMWLATSLLLAIVTRRLTGRLTLAVIVQILSFSVLTAFANEPMYPGDTALILVCGLLAAAVFAPRRPRIALTAIGALVGAALLTKVNVGGYAAIAVGYAAAMSLPRVPWRRIVRAAAIAAMVLVGPAVMTPTLNTGWTQRYAYLVAASALAVVVVTAQANTHSGAAGAEAERWVARMLGGLAGALALAIGVIFALGTTPGALYDAVIVTASRQAKVLDVPLALGPAAFYAPTAAVGVALIVRGAPAAMAGQRQLVGALRVLAGLALWYSVASPLRAGPATPRLVLALPLA